MSRGLSGCAHDVVHAIHRPMSTSGRSRRLGLLWALFSAVGGALMVIPWKLANEIGDPGISVLLLLLTAAIGSTGLGLAQRVVGRSLPRGFRRIDLAVAAGLAVFTLAGNHASAIAIQSLSPALLNVIMRFDFVFVAVLGWLLLGERVEGRFWIGAAIAVGGLVVLQGPGDVSDFSSFFDSGTFYGIAAAAFFSCMAILTRRFIHRIETVSVNSMRLWFSVIFWFAYNPLPDIAAIPVEQVGYTTLAAIFGPFLGRLALMNSARHLEARITTLATLSTPVMTLVLAFLVLGDWPLLHQLLGGAIMIGGIAIPLLPRPASSR